MSVRYRVLLVEDCAQDGLFTLRALARGGLDVESERVETVAQMRNALRTKTWDFILSDYHLSEFYGLASLNIYKETGLDIPFIVVSGLIGEEQAVQLIKAGAHEYVKKDNLDRLTPSVKRELQAAEERCIRRRAQATESFLISLIAHCEDAVIGETLKGDIVSWNPGAERLYGYTPSEILGKPISVLVPNFRPPETTVLELVTKGQQVPCFETRHMRKNGTSVEVSLT